MTGLTRLALGGAAWIAALLVAGTVLWAALFGLCVAIAR